MSIARKIWICLAASALAGGIAFYLGASDLSTGRDETATLLFPYAFWFNRWFAANSRIFMILVLAQFPLYGAVCCLAWCRTHPRKAVAWILFLHLALGFSLSHLNTVERRYL